jgi:hypothetical protein
MTPRAFISCSIQAVAIAFAGELVVGTRKDPAHAIEIVARGEAVLGDERLPARFGAHPGRRKEDRAVHSH